MLIGTFGGHHLGGDSCPTTFEVGSVLEIIAMGCFYAADILSFWVAFVCPFHAQTCDPKPFGIQSYVLALRCCILREWTLCAPGHQIVQQSGDPSYQANVFGDASFLQKAKK